MPPISASVPTARRSSSRRLAGRWKLRCCWRRCSPPPAPSSSAVFCVRLSGVYLAMLTLAFAQIVWSVVFQWDALTGGSNGLVGIWPAAWLAPKAAYYLLVLALTTAGCGLLVRMLHAPFGLALRASRDSPLRAAALGIRVPRLQWLAFIVAGTIAGLAGALFAFAKGTISPETLGVGKSVDGLVMVL